MMLKYMTIWGFWIQSDRSRRGGKTPFVAGHTASEQEAFDRRMSRSAAYFHPASSAVDRPHRTIGTSP